MHDIINLDNIDIHTKTERIASAVFLVSNLIPDNEAIRDRIKVLCIDLVSLGVASKKSEGFFNTNIKDIEIVATELLSLLNISFLAGFISEMNASVLRSEFENLLRTLATMSQNSGFSKKTIIPKEFFIDSFKKDNKDNIVNDYGKSFNERVLLPTTIESGHVNRNGFTDSNRKDQRSKAILNILNKKGDANIKDISALIKGCSEKTIQREINNMIQAGLIKRSGDRRWSRYSLA